MITDELPFSSFLRYGNLLFSIFLVAVTDAPINDHFRLQTGSVIMLHRMIGLSHCETATDYSICYVQSREYGLA